MSHTYYLRNHKHSPNYRDTEEEDEEDEVEDPSSNKESYEDDEESGEEDTLSPHHLQNQNTSHLSTSDASHLDNSNSPSGPVTISTSFTYYHGPSPTARAGAERLYPDLTGRDGSQGKSLKSSPSPVLKRRDLHAGSKPPPRSSPENHSPSRVRYQPGSKAAVPKKQSLEYVFFGLPLIYWILLLALLIVFCLWSRLVIFPAEPEGKEQEHSKFDQFSDRLQNLKQQFPSQTKQFWRVVRSCTWHLFNPELATYPAVLLMVGKKQHSVLASQIAEAVQLEFESIKLGNPSQAEPASLNLTSLVENLNTDDQKLALDKWLQKKLDKSHVAVVVNHLESLLPEAALLLHAYCDGDNAPYKDAMLIFGLFFDHSVDTPQAAEEALKDLWMSEFMKDKIGALLSRIANNIVLVKGPGDVSD